jgi:catechol 2,3-dioxygenase-like lactoylglutathione lyase family enzyme
MPFNQLNIITRDPEASRAFYSLLGVELSVGPDWPPGSGGYHASTAPFDTRVTLEFDNPGLLRFYASDAEQVRGPIVGFAFPSAEAVDATFERLIAAGHPALQKPYDAFWGARYAIVEDPDGTSVGLMGPIDRSRGYVPAGPPAA